MLFEWTENMDVGYNIINDQHKKLIDLINQLHDAMKEGKSKEVMSNILEELKNYTGYHFKTEEDMFEKFNYEETNDHKTEHQLFVVKVEDFINKYSNGDTTVSMDIMTFLKDWLINHIQKTDMHYRGLLE